MTLYLVIKFITFPLISIVRRLKQLPKALSLRTVVSVPSTTELVNRSLPSVARVTVVHVALKDVDIDRYILTLHVVLW